ncbi:type II toxin-antitoxin system RelB family antitoxin [Staphylococcus sp. Marseille-Q5304]|uniref:type II toxin-antitoxin system RelB family antitoxin n=1 Tax=Staphylococcus sp. Marseille-Q5304 TaxID=2942200 RepID=UPI002073BA80|nr:DUF6290 family protein [Staphylococcus sp. Marseille-Q5304]
MSKSQTITVRISEEDKKIIQHYSKIHGLSSSELLKKATLEKIEDEIDLEHYNQAMKEYEKDNTTYSVDDMDSMLGL